MRTQDDRVIDEITRTNRMTVEEMVTELDVTTTRHTYLYVSLDGKLSAIEKHHAETSPADEAKSIGYVRKLRGSYR